MHTNAITETQIPPCSISANMVDEWETRQWPLDKGKLRKGQSFYSYFKLEHVHDKLGFLDSVYEADGEIADAKIRMMTDYNN